MSLEFCSFSSGSSGNSYLIKSKNTNIIVDVGISGKRILDGVKSCGSDTIDAIFVTHEHSDHVQSLRTMSKKAPEAEIITSHGTRIALEEKFADMEGLIREQSSSMTIGNIDVHPFHLSHDATEPTGYTFIHGGKQITIITDTGTITDEISYHGKSADLLVLEANHEVNILQCGPYPYSLKRRILSDYGHLSNEAAAKYLIDILNEKQGIKVMLAHLSSENNSPFQAELTIKNKLFEEDIFIGKDLEMDILLKNTLSDLIQV